MMQMVSVYSMYPESVLLTRISFDDAKSFVDVRCVADWIRYRKSIRLKIRASMVIPNV